MQVRRAFIPLLIPVMFGVAGAHTPARKDLLTVRVLAQPGAATHFTLRTSGLVVLFPRSTSGPAEPMTEGSLTLTAPEEIVLGGLGNAVLTSTDSGRSLATQITTLAPNDSLARIKSARVLRIGHASFDVPFAVTVEK